MQRFTSPALLLVSAAALLTLVGYKSLEKTVSAARSDAQIAGDIQTKLSAEPAFSGADSPDVRVAVTNGVATLSGQAPDDNTRLMAAADASKIDGVKEVVNNMTLLDAQPKNPNTAVCPAPRRVRHRAKAKRERAPELASDFAPPAPEPEPAPVAPQPAPPPAPVTPQPAPVFAPPVCGCVPMVVMPAPIVVPAQPIFAWGFAPAIGIGISARPGWVRPWGWGARPFAFARPGGRGFAR
jgi:hypothetical protein